MPKKFTSIEERRAYSRKCYADSKGKYKEKILLNTRAHKIKSMQFVWDYLKEHPCVDCKESNPIVLEFDHLDDKVYQISDMLKDNHGIDSIKLEIEKCEVRCANCHRKKNGNSIKLL